MMKDDDFKLLRGFDNRQTDRRTDEQTFVIVELLSRLKRVKFSKNQEFSDNHFNLKIAKYDFSDKNASRVTNYG